MATQKSMIHNPDLQWQMPQPWMRVGENIGQGYKKDTIVAAWMASPGHRANILGDFTHIGIGYWVDDAGRGWFTQDFGKYDVPVLTAPNTPVTTAGKYDVAATWDHKWEESVDQYRAELYASDGTLLQTKTVPFTVAAVTFDGLTDMTTYTVSIVSQTTNALGEHFVSPTTTVTANTLEDAPTVTAVTDLALVPGESNLSASWTAPAGFNGALQPYNVELLRAGVLVNSIQTANANYTFTNLTSNTPYTVNVTATAAVQAKTSSATATVASKTLLSSVAHVSEPTTFAVAADTSSTIKATWGAPTTKVGSGPTYTLTLSTIGKPDVAVETMSTSYAFTGLMANTDYTVSIQASVTAENGFNSSTSSGVVTNVKTPLDADAVSVSAPVLRPVTVGPLQATLRWSPPANVVGKLVDYTLSVKQGGQPERNIKTTSTDFVVTGLLENTTYTFEVRANAASLNGTKFAAAASAPATHTTPYAPDTVLARNAPTGFQTASVTHNALALTWLAPAVVGTIADYLITVKETGKSDLNVRVAGTSYTLGGLTENSSYTIQLAANVVSKDGSKTAVSPSASVAVKTPYSPGTVQVNAPTGLVLSDVTANSLTAFWAAPTGTIGNITGYKVTLKKGTTVISTETVESLRATFSGLVGGTDYRVEVTALGASPDKTKTAVSAHTGVNGRTLAEIPFTDVTGNVFNKEIAWMKALGISTGYDDGTYRPHETVSREAMAAFMYRMAGRPAYTPPAVSSFTDVPTSHLFYKEIAWMKASGLSSGWLDGTYRPGEKISREAMAAFMHRYSVQACSVDSSVTKTFVDASYSAFTADIAWMGGASVSTGYDDGTYRPFDLVTREAMAAFMSRLSSHITANGGCKRP